MSRRDQAIELNQQINILIRSNNKLTKAQARAGIGYEATEVVLKEILDNAERAYALVLQLKEDKE